jgi:eukaryotic-like serine/threonine-protein kinase
MKTADEIAATAVTLGTAEREVFLDRACAGDASLRGRVETLLKVEAETLLSHPRQNADADAGGEAIGTLIGPYKLLRSIGAGGMGMVWIAEQQVPLRREVALKIIKPGMDSGEVIARFEAERQALAMMDHPNIAKVLDAGTTATGRPFFVMELVPGVPITQYCDDKRLGPRERLELLVPVCRAIQHAHQKGIIHRDIKPSNVLVSTYDGHPTPKVIDFGIAKATGPSSDGSKVTQFGAVVGTLEYMSPEQAETGGADIDTRSDIYSLGVVMYELLTGRTPLDWGEAQKAGYVEVLRRIREEEPPTPSTRLTKSPETLAEVAERRGIDPAKLPRLLRGELDWIVMKALEKDRGRRYETANGLGRDIEHYLNGEPVEASPPSATYRARKFARRHRLLLATVAGFLALLFGGIVVSTWQAVRAMRAESAAMKEMDRVMSAEKATRLERDRAMRAESSAMAERDRAMAAEKATRQERDRAMKAESSAMSARDNAMVQMHRADTEAETSRAVNEFLRKELLGHPDLTVRDALDRASAKLEGAFKDKPLTEASIRQTIGSAYADLGSCDEARPQLERALKLRVANQAPDDKAVINAKEALARLYAQQGDTASAEALLDDAKQSNQSRSRAAPR